MSEPLQRFGVGPLHVVPLLGKFKPGHGTYHIIPALDWWALEHGVTGSEREAIRKDAVAAHRAELEAHDLEETW